VNFETIEYAVRDRVASVTLARPEVRNAFDERAIRELTEVFSGLADSPGARVLVLTGKGSAFCAGADLSWMGKMRNYTYEENLEDANALAEMLRILYELPIPTIAAVNGPAIGGGNGLVAACDIAVAADTAFFSLSEVKIGLVPACIGPYVLGRIGLKAARELFLTGERIGADRALREGLVNAVVPAERLQERVQEYVRMLVTSGPEALRMSKSLVQNLDGMDLDDAGPYTAEMIARLRISDEAQEGMAAFFEKRPPRWLPEE
jgi:methylglutaconyl-CoA hydratase